MDNLVQTRRKRPYDDFLQDACPVPSTSSSSLSKAPRRRLCLRCAGIDLDEVLHRNIKNIGGSIVARLGTQAELRRSICPLCRVCLSYIAATHSSVHGIVFIIAFSTKRSLLGLKGGQYWQESVKEAVMLAVVATADGPVTREGALTGEARSIIDRSGYLGPVYSKPVTPDTLVRPQCRVHRLKLNAFNTSLARTWLAYCEDNHHTLCQSALPGDITNLQVLDCESRQVVSAPPACRYVALSYVWGSQQTTVSADVPASEFPQPLFPKVIEDSMVITARLGIQYLWVDRVCIDPSNFEEQHQQISQMDRIYSNAVFTIIAAAGDNPDHGLSGIGGTKRLPQPMLRIKGRKFASTLASPREVLSTSKWATRGWTYQEGLMSRRRLIFTDHQVFFDCRAMHCCESLDVPLNSLHYKNRRKSRPFNNASSPLAVIDPGANPAEYMKYVMEYTKRELTYSSDILNAFRGIQNAFATALTPLLTFYGIPVLEALPPSPYYYSHRWHRPMVKLSEGLLWSHDRRSWPIRQREGFPSWSWAG